MISRLPPTHFIGEKLPSKVKFQSALEYVGVDLELRSKKFPSILDLDKRVEINCIDLTCKLTPTVVKNFLARLGPNSTYFSIWVKKIWRSEKVGNSLFSGPCNIIILKWKKPIKCILEKIPGWILARMNLSPEPGPDPRICCRASPARVQPGPAPIPGFDSAPFDLRAIQVRKADIWIWNPISTKVYCLSRQKL